MMSPRLIITGTGRCGTKSILGTFASILWDQRLVHEWPRWPTVALSTLHAQGTVGHESTVAHLRTLPMADVVADFKLAPLARPALDVWPDARILWVRRDLESTVSSMVRLGWYADDEHGFVQAAVWDESVAFGVGGWGVPYRAWRLRPDRFVPDPLTSPDAWRDLGQAGRCRWWCEWVAGHLESVARDHPDRVAVVDLESVTAHDLFAVAEWVGVRPWMRPGSPDLARVGDHAPDASLGFSG